MTLINVFILLLVFDLASYTMNDTIQIDQIYYVSGANSQGRDIYKMNSDGSNKRKLTTKQGIGYYPHNNNPKLFPDRSKIVYQSDTDGHDRYTIRTMNVNGTNQKKITQKEGLYPNWSPDGKNIVFSGRREGVWELITIPSDGGAERLISNNKESGVRPGWGATSSFHPDGKSILYTYIREKVLYHIDMESNIRTRLGSEGFSYMNPIYSPDGKKIVINRKKEEGYDLIVIYPMTNEEKVIVKNIISYSSPSWSRNEKEILFTGSVNGSQEVFKINLQTNQEKRLTSNSAFDAMPTW
tara:strand:+ start:8783 stop:9673 length:891 start_codon:yes stop_codon:yes gene_type:complete